MICKDKVEQNSDYEIYINKFSKIKELIKKLNLMRKKGCNPKKELLNDIILESMNNESNFNIDKKIVNIDNELKNWNNFINKTFSENKLTQKQKYCLSFFLGKNLIQIQNNNIKHFMQFINPNYYSDIFDLESKKILY